LDTEDLVTFCYFHKPFPYYKADCAIFFNSINYFADIPSIAYFDSFANPFSRRTFLTSDPSLDTIYPTKDYLDKFDTVTLTSL
jgi:hypothetical protein